MKAKGFRKPAEGLAKICSGGGRGRLAGIADNSMSLLGDDTVSPLARTSGDDSSDDGSGDESSGWEALLQSPN